MADEVDTQAYGVRVEDGRLTIDADVHVVREDIRTGNGVIHVIDALLWEPQEGVRKTPFDDRP